jgi:hypothetical protein
MHFIRDGFHARYYMIDYGLYEIKSTFGSIRSAVRLRKIIYGTEPCIRFCTAVCFFAYPTVRMTCFMSAWAGHSYCSEIVMVTGVPLPQHSLPTSQVIVKGLQVTLTNVKPEVISS